MRIGERVHALLKTKRLSQKDLAVYLKINPSTINGWRQENRNPSSDLIIPICKFFDISPEYLLTGEDADIRANSTTANLLMFNSTSQKIDYKNKVLHLKEDSFFTRFKEAREAAGVSLEEAASGAFLSVDALRVLEDDDIPMMEIDNRMKQVREIGWEQLSYLAYKYDVDLYWLFCGKVRPPAAIVQDGRLVYPPYEFMMETSQHPKEETPKAKPVTPSLSASELAERIKKVFRTTNEHNPYDDDDDYNNLYPTDPEYDMQISWAAYGGAHLDPEKNEAMQQKLRLFEKRARLAKEAMMQQKKENEEK